MEKQVLGDFELMVAEEMAAKGYDLFDEESTVRYWKEQYDLEKQPIRKINR